MKAALKLALEALEWCHGGEPCGTAEAITAIKAALAQDVQYTGNGTAGREADVRPTGFFFQMPKPVGEVYGWHGSGKGQPMCRFDTTETEMPIGTELYTTPPQIEERNFCPRCGKRTADLTVIHTCTPPQENT